jgi:hypothetical protein
MLRGHGGRKEGRKEDVALTGREATGEEAA